MFKNAHFVKYIGLNETTDINKTVNSVIYFLLFLKEKNIKN